MEPELTSDYGPGMPAVNRRIHEFRLLWARVDAERDLDEYPASIEVVQVCVGTRFPTLLTYHVVVRESSPRPYIAAFVLGDPKMVDEAEVRDYWHAARLSLSMVRGRPMPPI